MSAALRRSLGRAWMLGLLVLPRLVWADEVAESAPAPVSVQAPDAEADTAASSVPWYQHIKQAARAYGVDEHLLQAVVAVESNFDANAVSRSGAIGLMQIMPATAAGFIGLRGTSQSLRQQLRDPVINVHAGALYLRSLLDTFSQRVDLALAAYNAGAGNVRKAGNRVPTNGQTPQYVSKVTALYASLQAAAQSAKSKALEAAAFSPAPAAFAPQ
jgi:soluble lytic murein transglycosylase-like protein